MTEAIVHMHELGKRFGKKTALDSISANVGRGDVIGVLGKNGAGKTTLLELVLGFGVPSAGTAEVFGEPSLALTERTKGRIGFVPQQDELVGMLTGRQQLAITAAFHASWDHALTERLVDKWEVPLETRCGSMSVGERQKLSVLAALGHHPELLVLDEPVASLDPIARRHFLRQLLDVSEDTSRAVLFSSHIVSDIERAANRVWILKEGRLHWDGELDALKESVARLHVSAAAGLPAGLELPGLLSCRSEGPRAVLTVAQSVDAAVAELARLPGVSVEREPLGLEDIFIELHR